MNVTSISGRISVTVNNDNPGTLLMTIKDPDHAIKLSYEQAMMVYYLMCQFLAK